MLISFHCAICGKEKTSPLSDYLAVPESLGKTVEEIEEIDKYICDECSKTDEYRRRFFIKKVPHIVLA